MLHLFCMQILSPYRLCLCMILHQAHRCRTTGEFSPEVSDKVMQFLQAKTHVRSHLNFTPLSMYSFHDTKSNHRPFTGCKFNFRAHSIRFGTGSMQLAWRARKALTTDTDPSTEGKFASLFLPSCFFPCMANFVCSFHWV